MVKRPLKIFTSSSVPRLTYIADLILRDILGLSWEIITDKRKIGNCQLINYSEENITGSFKISPSSLLFSTGITAQEILISDWNSFPVFFQTTTDSDLPFDIFAASFYLVTRYEEYIEFKPGESAGFRASDSLAFRHDFLRLPLVELWARELPKVLVKKYPSLAFKRNDYKSLLTIDIEEPFGHRGKGLLHYIRGLLHDLMSKNRQSSAGSVFRAKGENDQYTVFDYLTETIDRNNTQVKFFFPAGKRSGFNRRGPSRKNEKYRNLINGLACKYSTGLNSSFRSPGDMSVICRELAHLSNIAQKNILSQRFHRPGISLPASYRCLLEAGIREDYSLGYEDEPGFRAGIARPFRFYDLNADQVTDLTLIPFQITDTSLAGGKYGETVLAKDLINNLVSETRRTGSLFVSIWHNTSLQDNQSSARLRDMFEYTLKCQNN